MCRDRCREEPLAGIEFAIGLAVKGIDVAARAGHRGHYAVARVALIVVGHPSVDVTRLGRYLPAAAQMIPREYASEGVFALAVIHLGCVAIIGSEHLQLAVGVDVPRIQAETVATPRIIVGLLQDVQILERSAAVVLRGVVLADDIVVGIVDVLFLVVVAVLVLVGRRGVDGARRELPMVVAVGQAQELIEGLERAHALNILKPKALGRGGLGGESHRATQSATHVADRRCAVQQRGIVDKIGGNHRKVGHSHHRVVDAHTVPHHLRMRGRSASERDC